MAGGEVLELLPLPGVEDNVVAGGEALELLPLPGDENVVAGEVLELHPLPGDEDNIVAGEVLELLPVNQLLVQRLPYQHILFHWVLGRFKVFTHI